MISQNSLTNTDSLMWLVENDPMLRSTILGVMVLDHTPDWGRIEHRIEWLTGELPMLRQRVVASTVNPSRLRWEMAPDFDLRYHVRRVGLTGDRSMEAVLELARNSAMSGFDRARPLWEFTLVDGLEDGKAALVTKLHHVLTDGIGAVQLAAHLFDFEASPPVRKDEQLHPHLTVEPLDPVVRFAGDVIHEVGAATDAVTHQLWHALPNFVRTALRPRQTFRDSTEVVKSAARVVAPTMTTLSPVMRERSMSWSFHTLQVPLDELRAAAKAAGGRLNDAFLGGITGGLRRYHEEHLSPVDELRVAMPISLRDPKDREGGNHVTIMRFLVNVGLVDPDARIRSLSTAVNAQRHEASLPFTDAIAGLLSRVPNAVLGSMLKHVDFLASNVPGTPIPLYLEGARVEEWYPFGPTAGSAVNVTLMSYCGTCCIGVNLDAHAVPDAELFMDCLRQGFDEVLALA